MSTIAEQLGLSEETVQRLIGDYLNAHILAVFAYALYIMIFGAPMRLMVSFGVAWNAMYATYVTHGQTQDAIFGCLESGTSRRRGFPLTSRRRLMLFSQSSSSIHTGRLSSNMSHRIFVSHVVPSP
ncbi:hypothetical protein BDZ89DRAFT_1076590 [Hymenopellis radicata]|nr:hypothetical protein BDZ89DRAFT_1076590 [Hymenopellis radicata]